MKRDFKKYNQARLMRKSGFSIRAIAKELKISSSTSSIWCRDVKLSSQARQKLDIQPQRTERLRLYAQKRHEDKVYRNNIIFEESVKSISALSKNEFFLVGLALYWAEGFKNISEQRVGFCNSDPKMIILMLKWFKNILEISLLDFTLRAEFNIAHLARKHEIEKYWSDLTGIPLSQFNNPYLQRSKQVRDYSGKGKYYGVLRIRIRRSSSLLVRLRGWISGLNSAGFLKS